MNYLFSLLNVLDICESIFAKIILFPAPHPPHPPKSSGIILVALFKSYMEQYKLEMSL